NWFRQRTTLRSRRKSPTNRLSTPEVQLLRTTLSEVSTISSRNFDPNRYVRSVAGAEESIASSSNSVVFGRRGSGKSSLLAYHLHELKESGTPFAWIDMQTYSESLERNFVADVFSDILNQIQDRTPSRTQKEIDEIRGQLA